VEGNLEVDPALERAWCCPNCAGALATNADTATCRSCARAFARTDGIWQLYWPHESAETDVTESVKRFYEQNPFPNYDDHDSVQSLIAKSRAGIYARLLSEQIPFNSDVLEVGCGTGQLTNFLGVGCRSVTGIDLCLNSLRLAEEFRRRHALARVRFAQMNLFRPALADAQYDVVLCNGVLHHTSDPFGGFQRVAKLVRPGGYLIVGLYNRYGRLALDARRLVFRATGGRGQWLDPHIRTTPMSEAKRRAWFADQYQHPHESKHTVGEVLDWFGQTGFDFVNSLPKPRVTASLDHDDQLFEQEPAAGWMDRALSQARQVFTGSREGGFFVMIGRKRGTA
jgi:SAM-dependent methyltransferase